jgi:hypothetical protein
MFLHLTPDPSPNGEGCVPFADYSLILLFWAALLPLSCWRGGWGVRSSLLFVRIRIIKIKQNPVNLFNRLNFDFRMILLINMTKPKS